MALSLRAENLKASGAFLLEGMTRILLRSRRLMAVSVLLLLAGVVALSAASRKPGLQASTAPWRVWKASHMAEAPCQVTGKLRVDAEAPAPQAPWQELLALPPSTYFPHEETMPPVLSLVAQIRHFRSPPALG